MILYFGKSAVNPLIYGWKNRDFRLAFARLLRYVPCKWAMERSLDSMELEAAAGIRSRSGSVLQHSSRPRSKIYQLELPPIEWRLNSSDASNDLQQMTSSVAMIGDQQVTNL